MTREVATVPVRLPLALKAEIEKLAQAEGISLEQFLASAAAEKLSAMRSAQAFFANRQGRGDMGAAIRLLTRNGGEAPAPGDELPPS